MKLIRRYFLFFIALIFLCNCIFSLSVGNSAWIYGIKNSWIQQINKFNSAAREKNKFNYLFVTVGSARVSPSKKQLIISYDKEKTKFYKKSLKGVSILSNISFWVKGTGFYKWNASQYKAAADKIAHLIISDPNSSGVFLDLESYRKTLLPFYIELRKKLSAHNKIISVIVSPGDENVSWFNELGPNSIVVLYGYDLHKNTDPSIPVAPKVYASRLTYAVKHFISVANSSKRFFMIGVPAIATTYEWQRKMVMSGQVLKNPFKQIDYFKRALSISKAVNSKYYLGVSVWAFISDIKGQIYFPLTISNAEWKLLKG